MLMSIPSLSIVFYVMALAATAGAGVLGLVIVAIMRRVNRRPEPAYSGPWACFIVAVLGVLALFAIGPSGPDGLAALGSAWMVPPLLGFVAWVGVAIRDAGAR